MLTRELLFTDDAAITTHSYIELQTLAGRLAEACNVFGLTVTVRKIEVIGQPGIKLGAKYLKTADTFAYLGSTLTSTLSLDEKLKNRIGKAAAVLKKILRKKKGK